MFINGIILKQNAVNEKDAMVTVLTKDGLVDFFAQGIYKITSKNAPALSYYHYSKLCVFQSSRENLKLRDAVIVEDYSSFANDYEKTSVLSCMSELSLKVIDAKDNSLTFDYFLSALRLMKDGFDPLTICNVYFAACLSIGGYGLNVDNCVFCGSKTQINSLSFENGGFVCKACNEDNENIYTPKILKIFRYIFKVSPEQMNLAFFTKEENMLVFNELSKYLEDQTGLKLVSKELIKKI